VRNILQTVKRKKANWIGHIFNRDCLLKRVIEGVEVRRKRGRRSKQLFDGLKGTGECCKPIEEALDRAWFRTRFARGNRLIRQEAE
jgi:hypothetical protein